MVNTAIRETDGKYNMSFAEHYTIDADFRVWSRRRKKFLRPDSKHRIFLSANGHIRRVNVYALRRDSLAALSHIVVKKITNAKYKEIHLGEYYWRIPYELDFLFDTQRYAMPIEVMCHDSPALLDRFFRKLMETPRSNQRKSPSYREFYNWSQKYVSELAALPDEMSLYRALPAPLTPDSQRVLQGEKTFLDLHAAGSLMLKRVSGQLTTLRPAAGSITSLSYQSRLLANNRLTFLETENLISGPFTPLLAWVFLGTPQVGQRLFNLTGNSHDFHINNYVWLDLDQFGVYTNLRSWLINRWQYEVWGRVKTGRV